VNELQEITGLSQPALSMHLARLREEEMVTTEKSGRHVYYRIGDDRLADLVQYVCQRFSCQ
jgi:DNA-binding transcriptional ArsR family regulator